MQFLIHVIRHTESCVHHVNGYSLGSRFSVGGGDGELFACGIAFAEGIFPFAVEIQCVQQQQRGCRGEGSGGENVVKHTGGTASDDTVENFCALFFFAEVHAVKLAFVKFDCVADKRFFSFLPLFNENGVANAGVLYANTSIHTFDLFELKLIGFANEEQKNSKLAMGAYVIADRDGEKKISYMQNGQAENGEKYYFASYAEMIALAK